MTAETKANFDKPARPTLTVCMGAPASGKSTWCEANSGEALVLSGDEIRAGKNPRFVFERMMRLAMRALVSGRDVIIDACSTRHEDRIPWLVMAEKYSAATRLVILDTPALICARRDGRRRRPAGRADVYAARMKRARTRIRSEDWGEIEIIVSKKPR